MEFTAASGLEAVCADLEEVSHGLQQEFRSSPDPAVQQLPDLIRRIEALQAVSERIRGKAELLLSQRQAGVLHTMAGLLENARRVRAAQPPMDSSEIDTAASALTASMQSCSFLQGAECDAVISGVHAAACDPAADTVPSADEEPAELTEEDQLFASFEALPKHVRGHIKFADVLLVLKKISGAVDELVAEKLVANKAMRQRRAAVSRYSMKLSLKDLYKYCGQKASGKSGQAILLILRSMDIIKLDREYLTLVDSRPPSTLPLGRGEPTGAARGGRTVCAR